jgi:hypothetical protein
VWPDPGSGTGIIQERGDKEVTRTSHTPAPKSTAAAAPFRA